MELKEHATNIITRWKLIQKASYDYLGLMKWEAAIKDIEALRDMQQEFLDAVEMLEGNG